MHLSKERSGTQLHYIASRAQERSHPIRAHSLGSCIHVYITTCPVHGTTCVDNSKYTVPLMNILMWATTPAHHNYSGCRSAALRLGIPLALNPRPLWYTEEEGLVTGSLASQAIFHGRKWAGRSEGKLRLVTNYSQVFVVPWNFRNSLNRL